MSMFQIPSTLKVAVFCDSSSFCFVYESMSLICLTQCISELCEPLAMVGTKPLIRGKALEEVPFHLTPSSGFTKSDTGFKLG